MISGLAHITHPLSALSKSVQEHLSVQLVDVIKLSTFSTLIAPVDLSWPNLKHTDVEMLEKPRGMRYVWSRLLFPLSFFCIIRILFSLSFHTQS